VVTVIDTEVTFTQFSIMADGHIAGTVGLITSITTSVVTILFSKFIVLNTVPLEMLTVELPRTLNALF
jgi:hypothetical protein